MKDRSDLWTLIETEIATLEAELDVKRDDLVLAARRGHELHSLLIEMERKEGKLKSVKLLLDHVGCRTDRGDRPGDSPPHQLH